MAQVVVTLKIMPTNTKTNLKLIEKRATGKISEFGGEVGKVNINEVAFGLKSLELLFVMDESIGSTEELEENVKKIKGVNSVEITDVRRAIG